MNSDFVMPRGKMVSIISSAIEHCEIMYVTNTLPLFICLSKLNTVEQNNVWESCF